MMVIIFLSQLGIFWYLTAFNEKNNIDIPAQQHEKTLTSENSIKALILKMDSLKYQINKYTVAEKHNKQPVYEIVSPSQDNERIMIRLENIEMLIGSMNLEISNIKDSLVALNNAPDNEIPANIHKTEKSDEGLQEKSKKANFASTINDLPPKERTYYMSEVETQPFLLIGENKYRINKKLPELILIEIDAKPDFSDDLPVYIEFVINKDGMPEDVYISCKEESITEGINQFINQKAIWIPGKVGNKTVKTNIEMRFKIKGGFNSPFPKI